MSQVLHAERRTGPNLRESHLQSGIRPAIGFLLLALGLATASASAMELQLEQALPLEGNEMLQPSGLALVKGSLYLISCKHDDQIFAVNLSKDKAAYQEALHITRPPDAANLKFIWRGLASDEDGRFLLVSETAYRVMRLDKNGKGEWFGPSVMDAGTEIGLFGGENSGPDGVASLSKSKWVMGASREPRGLLRLDLQGEKADIKPQKCEKSKVAPPAGRKPDFTDLTTSGKTLYALEGSANAICSLTPDADGHMEEGQCWSFAATSEDAKYRYRGLKGIARGLAMDEAHIYVALDNKGLARESDPKDRRPQILVFKRP